MKRNLYTLLAFSLLLLTTLSCTKDFEEMNQDPNGFTTASDGSLLNGVIQSLILTGNEQFYIQNEILYKQTQQAALTASAWGNYSIGTEDIWSNYYGSLAEIRELEKRFSEKPSSTPGLNNMLAIVKILKAYKTFKVTDLFGDIPYSEAGYGFQNLASLHPRYDTQKDIYLSLLADLEWADTHINPADVAEPFKTFAVFDKLFRGDMISWWKFANSLRLRYAMRMSEKEPELAGAIIRNIIQENRPVMLGYDILNPVLESACLWPSTMGFKNSSVNWSFREHNNLRMGSCIWHCLSAHDSTDGSGIFDPRAFIFFETNEASKWVAYPQLPDASTPPSQGIPYAEFRDDEAYFNIKRNCNYSPFNYFLIRDEDKIPVILMTGAEVHFILAEAWLRGIGVPADENQANIEYMNGLNASIEWWEKTAENSVLPVSGMKFPDWVHIPVNISAATVLNVYGFWNVSSDEEKLRFIYTQRWLDAFRQPQEAYALARRTGKTPREGQGIQHYRLPYPQSEVIYNTANVNEAISRQGGDAFESKIWWIPN